MEHDRKLLPEHYCIYDTGTKVRYAILVTLHIQRESIIPIEWYSCIPSNILRCDKFCEKFLYFLANNWHPYLILFPILYEKFLELKGKF